VIAAIIIWALTYPQSVMNISFLILNKTSIQFSGRFSLTKFNIPVLSLEKKYVDKIVADKNIKTCGRRTAMLKIFFATEFRNSMKACIKFLNMFSMDILISSGRVV